MRIFITWVLILGSIIGFFVFLAKHTDHYNVRGTCKDKLYTSDKNGHASYIVLVLYDDGSGHEFEVSPTAYMTYTIGGRYIFEEDSFCWSKPQPK